LSDQTERLVDSERWADGVNQASTLSRVRLLPEATGQCSFCLTLELSRAAKRRRLE